MTPSVSVLRRVALAASVCATAAGLAELWVVHRATGAIGWAHLVRVLAYPLAPLSFFGWLAAAQRERQSPGA
jgi:hypothetical protein